jgi:hypothetical protein
MLLMRFLILCFIYNKALIIKARPHTDFYTIYRNLNVFPTLFNPLEHGREIEKINTINFVGITSKGVGKIHRRVRKLESGASCCIC